jgi:hypothetical protein
MLVVDPDGKLWCDGCLEEKIGTLSENEWPTFVPPETTRIAKLEADAEAVRQAYYEMQTAIVEFSERSKVSLTIPSKDRMEAAERHFNALLDRRKADGHQNGSRRTDETRQEMLDRLSTDDWVEPN